MGKKGKKLDLGTQGISIYKLFKNAGKPHAPPSQEPSIVLLFRPTPYIVLDHYGAYALKIGLVRKLTSYQHSFQGVNLIK